MPGPTPPSNLTATADGNGGVSLSWQRTSPGTFSIYRDTSSTGNFSTQVASGLGSSPYTDTSVSSGTSYYYRATTVLNGQESLPSSTAGPVTP